MATGPGEVTLSESERVELAALRRRGYGPDGGLSIAGADRLRVLEERILDGAPGIAAVGAPLGAADDDADAAHDDADAAPAPAGARPVPGQDVPPGATQVRSGAPGDDRETPHRPVPRHPVLVAVAAVAVGALLVALGSALGRPPEAVDDESLAPVAVDQERAAVVMGAASFSVRRLDPDSLVQYASLGQGTPWSATDAAGGHCLILTVTDDSPELIAAAGVWDVRCAPAGLPAIIDWRVDPSFPSPPQQLPDGSVVRLTLHDDRVGISIGRPE